MNSDLDMSPIEKIFWEHAQESIPDLQPQVWIERYRVDFLIATKNIVVELDGHENHKSIEDRTRDASRERYLERLGYRVIRFTGHEIFHSPQKCVREVIDFIEVLEQSYSDTRVNTNKLLYCARMQEVITHLLDKYSININDEALNLTLYQEHFDRLSIRKSDSNLIEVCHYYLLNDDPCYDPSIVFAIHFDQYTDTKEWVPLYMQTIWDNLLDCA